MRACPRAGTGVGGQTVRRPDHTCRGGWPGWPGWLAGAGVAWAHPYLAEAREAHTCPHIASRARQAPGDGKTGHVLNQSAVLFPLSHVVYSLLKSGTHCVVPLLLVCWALHAPTGHQSSCEVWDHGAIVSCASLQGCVPPFKQWSPASPRVRRSWIAVALAERMTHGSETSGRKRLARVCAGVSRGKTDMFYT